MENQDLKTVQNTEIVDEENASINDDLLSESETGKIMAEIKATQAVNKKNEKKQKQKKEKVKKEKPAKGEKKKKKKSSLVILACLTGIICGGGGYFGGYFLYTMTKPEVQYEAESNDLRAIEAKGDASTNLLETFKDDAYNLVNYSMVKYAKRKFTCTVAKNIAENFSGVQHIYSACINNNNKTFNQAISNTEEGSFIQLATAFRFYDNHDEIITAYEYDKPEEWTADMEPTKIYTYDEFMDSYGKINHGLYIVDENKKYLTSDYTQTENELISSITIFQITKRSVKSSVLTELPEGGYQIDMELYSNRACFYESKNVKANGRLPKNPTFKEIVKMTVFLDSNFNLNYSKVTEEYRVTMGVEVDVVVTAFNRYFYSDTDQLTINGHDIHIPEKDEHFPIFINDQGEFI